MIVFGAYDLTLPPPEVTARKAAIQAAAREHGFGSVSFEFPDFHRALIKARDVAATARQVAVIIGYLEDLHPPASVVPVEWTPMEWRESWLALAEEYRVPFHSVGRAVPGPLSAQSRSSVIRSFQAAQKALVQHLKRERTIVRRSRDVQEKGYAGGRPPYGYRVVDGTITIDATQAKLVKLVFESIRNGLSVSKTCQAARNLDPHGFWDGVKIRRILRHAALYTRGIYQPPEGDDIPLEGVSFLPEEWESTATLSRAKRQGTMEVPHRS